MGTLELGAKCTCVGCGGRFYNLNRSPSVCPKCGVEQPPEKLRAVRPSRTSFGSRRLERQPEQVFAEAEPATTSDADEDVDAEDGEAVPEPDDEVDDDLGIDPGLGKVVA
jgi:uncharacterized protein (TIGR02300 family)